MTAGRFLFLLPDLFSFHFNTSRFVFFPVFFLSLPKSRGRGFFLFSGILSLLFFYLFVSIISYFIIIILYLPLALKLCKRVLAVLPLVLNYRDKKRFSKIIYTIMKWNIACKIKKNQILVYYLPLFRCGGVVKLPELPNVISRYMRAKYRPTSLKIDFTSCDASCSYTLFIIWCMP